MRLQIYPTARAFQETETLLLRSVVKEAIPRCAVHWQDLAGARSLRREISDMNKEKVRDLHNAQSEQIREG